ncbi:hypothetical protein [Clostridioides difficile]|uniref:hypothetical protein n=1 Tax=Clostridioides difficile TaxID=1496 RepID=UPI00017F4D9A|nr:hypothetical protein [Clostridioides difficile]
MIVIAYIEIRVVVKNISIDDTIKIKNGTGNPVFNINGYTENAIGMNISAHIVKEMYKLVIFRYFEKIPILTAATRELKEIAPSARPYKKLLAPIVIFTIYGIPTINIELKNKFIAIAKKVFLV